MHCCTDSRQMWWNKRLHSTLARLRSARCILRTSILKKICWRHRTSTRCSRSFFRYKRESSAQNLVEASHLAACFVSDELQRSIHTLHVTTGTQQLSRQDRDAVSIQQHYTEKQVFRSKSYSVRFKEKLQKTVNSCKNCRVKLQGHTRGRVERTGEGPHNPFVQVFDDGSLERELDRAKKGGDALEKRGIRWQGKSHSSW